MFSSRLSFPTDELIDASTSEVVHPSMHSDFLGIRIRPRSGNRFRLADIVDLHDDIGFNDLVQRFIIRARGEVEGLNARDEGA